MPECRYAFAVQYAGPARLMGIQEADAAPAELVQLCTKILELVDQLLQVSADARSKVLLVQRRVVTTDALDGGFV